MEKENEGKDYFKKGKLLFEGKNLNNKNNVKNIFNNYFKSINYLGIGDWGLGPIPNPQSPIPINQNFPGLIYI